MRRRTFLQAAGSSALLTLTPRPSRMAASSLSVLIKMGRAGGWFPHISGPRAIVAGGHMINLASSSNNSYLITGGMRVTLGLLERARMSAGSMGSVHVAGTRGRELWYLPITNHLRPKSIHFATLAELHPAVGVDIAWTSEGPLIVGPGPEAHTLALYAPGSGHPPLVLARRRWAHPLLSYDARRHRLHLLFCGWNDYSSFYDVLYYMCSDDHGRSWLQANGSPVATPFEYPERGPEPDILSRRQQNNGGESNTLAHCLALDMNGRPHLLYSFCRPYFIALGPATTQPVEPRMRTKHVGWSGTEWIASEMSPDFAVDIAGGALVIENPQILHALVMYKPLDADWLDLVYTRSENGGRTWQRIRAVTSDASRQQAHYVAPCLVQSGSRLKYVCTASAMTPTKSPIYTGSISAPFVSPGI